MRERGTDLGVIAGAEPHQQLRVLRNGYVEFRTPADDESFHWAQSGDPKPVNPCAIVEPAVAFPLLVKEVCSLAGHESAVRLGLALLNIKGMYLLPYAPEAVGYRHATYRLGQADGPQPFGNEHLKTPPIDVRVNDLPGSAAWRLVAEVYYRFGYSDEEIPFFNDQHEYTAGIPRTSKERT